MHLQFCQEQYGIFMKGKGVVCLYIALLCMIMVQLTVAGWKSAVVG